MLRLGYLSAWIGFDGNTSPTYDVRMDTTGRFISGWIASEADRKFSVNWYNARRDISLEGVVTIDGVVCNTHVMLARDVSPSAPDALMISFAQTSNSTRHDFMFSRIQLTDSDEYLHTIDSHSKFGVIELALWRISVAAVHHQQRDFDPPSQNLGPQVIHERAKRSGDHHVRFGEEYRSSSTQHKDLVNGHRMDREPLVRFTFRYRPIELLMADGIAPRSSHKHAPHAPSIKQEERSYRI